MLANFGPFCVDFDDFSTEQKQALLRMMERIIALDEIRRDREEQADESD